MTLLEALVALVILGVSAVGCLEVFQGGSRSLRLAADWQLAVAMAESTMEVALVAGAGLGGEAKGDASGEPFERAVSVRPWGDGLSEVVVDVRGPGGVRFELRRLVRVP